MKALERPKYLKDADKSTYAETVWKVSFCFWIPHDFGEVDMDFLSFYFLDRRKAEIFHRRLGILSNQDKIENLKIEAVQNCSKKVEIEESVPMLDSRWDSSLSN